LFIKSLILDKKLTIKQIAIKTIEIEAEALHVLKDNIGDEFVASVECIAETTGRVIICGIGKSAIIAQKIVATLNSTGTPSIFLHAADAIHGDLGTIQNNDVVMILSKSGETDELKVLLPLIKNFGNKTIAIVCNKTSYLAKNVDFCLYTPLSKEADPNNLAPTTSTTLQMAMGDAIATSLLALKGFSPSDFAQFHPGGSLGKQLYLRMEEIATSNPKPKVYLDSNIRSTIIEISGKRLGATAVLDKEDMVVGIITDGDLRRMLQQEGDVSQLKAKDIMTPEPKSIQSDELAAKGFALMRANSISQLVILKGLEYAGMVHIHDIMREGIL